jgi:hypothetical protein
LFFDVFSFLGPFILINYPLQRRSCLSRLRKRSWETIKSKYILPTNWSFFDGARFIERLM